MFLWTSLTKLKLCSKLKNFLWGFKIFHFVVSTVHKLCFAELSLQSWKFHKKKSESWKLLTKLMNSTWTSELPETLFPPEIALNEKKRKALKNIIKELFESLFFYENIYDVIFRLCIVHKMLFLDASIFFISTFFTAPCGYFYCLEQSFTSHRRGFQRQEGNVAPLAAFYAERHSNANHIQQQTLSDDLKERTFEWLINECVRNWNSKNDSAWDKLLHFVFRPWRL